MNRCQLDRSKSINSTQPGNSLHYFLRFVVTIGVATSGVLLSANIHSAERAPNVVIVFLDDSGWSDFHPFGAPPYPTPNVARLAKEGCRFDNFYVPQAICSASRSALMTGCYPGRTRVFGAHPPKARGLDPKFATLGNVLQSVGYKTAIFGKWHLGDQPDTRPPARGFDESSGLMYSNDMWKFHPEDPDYWGKYPLPYWKNGEVTIKSVSHEHQAMLTTWYTEDAVDFINRTKGGPFLLYVPHSMPHVPIYCSEKFKGKSGAGLYGDVMMEIDWSVGEILNAIEANQIENDTIVLFTSDNGPWVSYGNHAGATPFREAKATGFDGGIRSACIVKYPGHIEAGSRSTNAFCSIDILPTIAKLAGAKLPDNEIDGKNVWDLIIDEEGVSNPHSYYAFSTGSTFEGVISGDGRWKLHLPHRYRTLIRDGKDGQPGKYEVRTVELSLFDLQNDPTESKNVFSDHPIVATRLKNWAEEHRKTFYGK